ncbi:RNA polymerase sigma factor RpoD/SigA [Caloranaerobacter sp. TR13]|uniref:sigma-70 family RNA polymerase sigma factor n=1 Tax=Caloranaerobacter sp. TR13 TaxID=1302151 RepID=UPI0006D42A5D|nr:RNA polymerase sigma factor RpoD/SigA [Caloranaerobacter sp. TR13]
MKVKELIIKYRKNNNSFIDAFEIYDDLESLIGKSPSIEIFKNVIAVLKDELGKEIININEVLEIEFEEDYTVNNEKEDNKSYWYKSFNENLRLIKEYKKTKDINIRNQIIVNNIKLIKKYAYKYSAKSSLEYDDLVNEGVFGMIHAIESFDTNRNNEFSTYAVYWIKQRIRRAVQDKGYIIRLPVHLNEKIEKLIRLENKFAIMGLDIDEKEICKALDITIEKYYELKKINNTFLNLSSLNAFVGDEEESELIEFIPADEEESLEDIIIKKELSKEIDLVLSTLKPREENVIRQRFGFDNGEEKTLEQVGKNLGVTRERIRQIETKAIKKLRHPIRSKRLRAYLN